MLTLILLKDPYQQHKSYITLDQDFYLQEILFAWVFLPLALLKHHVKNGRSSGNEKALIQNEDCEVFFNDVKCEDEIMEETQKDSSLKIRKVKFF